MRERMMYIPMIIMSAALSVGIAIYALQKNPDNALQKKPDSCTETVKCLFKCAEESDVGGKGLNQCADMCHNRTSEVAWKVSALLLNCAFNCEKSCDDIRSCPCYVTFCYPIERVCDDLGTSN